MHGSILHVAAQDLLPGVLRGALPALGRRLDHARHRHGHHGLKSIVHRRRRVGTASASRAGPSDMRLASGV